MQFFRSCFRERGSPNGEDFYPQTRRFPAAILGGSQGEATQYTDKKTAQAVCNAYENGLSGRNEMKEKGWRPFWAALLAALLVLLPLVGGTVLLTRRSLRTRLASRPQGGIAIRQPKEENRLSLLVCIAPTETTAPGFLLLYLNASQNCIHALALPGELTVPFGADETALSDCYRAAGPARCREALLSALSLPEDTHYLALAPSVLQAIADRYGMLRVGFSGALTAEELALTGCSSNVQAVSAREAEELLNGMEDTVPPAHKAAAELVETLMGTTPLKQISKRIDVKWEDPVVPRYNGQRSQRVQCSPVPGVETEKARQSIATQIEQIPLPDGYRLQWQGERNASTKSMQYLFKNFPFAIILMISILIMLFKDYRKPVIIFCTIPLVFVGVVAVMLLTGKTFNFVAIVGTLGLIGMIIKNGIVLMDEITLQINQGVEPVTALIDSSQSRLRPVMMASLTTILGMIPLLPDAMFGSLAASIMGGLLFGTLITLLFIPILYALFFHIKKTDK